MVFRDSEGKELRRGCQVRYQGDGNIYTIADFRNGLAPGGKAELKFEEEHAPFVTEPSEHNVILVKTAEEMRAEFESQEANKKAEKTVQAAQEAIAEVEDFDDIEDDEEPTFEVPKERKRPRGRPKGSRNKAG